MTSTPGSAGADRDCEATGNASAPAIPHECADASVGVSDAGAAPTLRGDAAANSHLVRIDTAVSRFKPESAQERDAQADAVIRYARRVLDWPMLQKAVAQKLEDQREFVGWWDATVRINGRPKKNFCRTAEVLTLAEAEKKTKICNWQVSRWRRRLKDPESYKAFLYGAAWAKAMADNKGPLVLKYSGTGDPESYTPSVYIEAARSVMGGIDLDPASNSLAQKTVKATRWYGQKEGGLSKPWIGRVFLNPPYAFPTIAHFIDKLCEEIASKRVTDAILLTNNSTDTAWWHQAAKLAAGVCFTAGRINFYKADGSKTQPTNGQTFFYFGRKLGNFNAVFAKHGFIMVKP